MTDHVPYKGGWATLMAACLGDIPYQMPDIFLPDADCKHCSHKSDPQGGHCYMFAKRPGDRCGQFTKRGL